MYSASSISPYVQVPLTSAIFSLCIAGRNNTEVQKGIIPNKARAEELATAQFNASKKEQSTSESRGSFFRRRRNSHRRSKSLGRVRKILNFLSVLLSLFSVLIYGVFLFHRITGMMWCLQTV